MQGHIPVFILDKFIALPTLEIKLDITNEYSKKVVKASSKNNLNKLLVIAPKNFLEVSLSIDDLPKVGVICDVKSKIELTNGTMRVTLVGQKRVSISAYFQSEKTGILKCSFEEIELPKINASKEKTYIRKLKNLTKEYVSLKDEVSNSILKTIKDVNDLNLLTDVITSFVSFDFSKKLIFMQEINPLKRAEILISDLNEEINLAHLDEELNEKISNNLNNDQRSFLLKEKLKEINKELGNTKEEEIIKLNEKLDSLTLPDTIKNKLANEIKKFSASSDFSPESAVIKNYLDVVLNLPWNRSTDISLDKTKVRNILNENHYGLGEIKNRIVEYVSLKKHNNSISSPIICLVGPPGVGKTSIAMAISKALNLEFYKISVGGLNDSTELIGSRRTYLGALPGKIMQGIIKLGVNNPLILIDEVDKMVKDYKGDPASTLLEILDPTQNKYFTDNFIEEPFDISKVFFILTANDEESIPPVLKDRLEIIHLDEYDTFEKECIAKDYLLPNINKEYNLDYKINKDVINYIILNYTAEKGVRELKRKLEMLVRKVYSYEENNTITKKIVDKYLSGKKENLVPKINDIGICNILAYTTLGGIVSHVEVSMSKGNGNITITGNCENVLKESIEVVRSYLQNNYNLSKTNDLHVHFIYGGTKKDGPSAGVSVACAILSLLKNKKIPDDVAFTGEVSLKGLVLPVGGIKEKILAAVNNDIKTIYVPLLNKNDVLKINKEILGKINVKYVSTFDDIYNDTFK